MMPIDKIKAHINVKSFSNGRYKACCPAHDDRSPSLSIRELPDGMVVLHCFAGCQPQAIVEAMGLEMGDLFVDDLKPNYQRDMSDQITHEKLVLQMLKDKRERLGELDPLDMNRAELAVHRLRSVR